MNPVAMFFSFVLGLPCGVGIALLVVSNMLNKSNNFGDTKGTLYSFSIRGIEGRSYQDRIKKNTPLDPVRNPVIIQKDNEKSQKASISETSNK